VIRNITVGIVGILNKTGEGARILERRGKTDGKENFVDFLIPMLRAAAKAIKSLEKKPIFIWLSLGITRGRPINGNLFQGQNALAKCVFTIALAEEGRLIDHQRNQKPKRVATKNRSKADAFAPDTVFVVAKDNNPRFGLKRIEILVTFYSEDTHRRDSFGSPFLLESAIFAQGNLVVGVHTLDVLLFLKETA
jgi:hypothetical protein